MKSRAVIEVKLRDYQIKLAEAFSNEIKAHKRIVVSCPTGSGKTVLALDGLLPVLSHPVGWVTHRRELAQQIKNCGALVDVVMSQSSKPKGGFSSIIIDEAHHACADQYRRIMAANPKAVIVALTATPYRMDGAGLGSCGFTKIIHGPDVFDLTNQGWLCPARVYIPASESNSAWTPTAAVEKVKAVRFKQAIIYCRTVIDAEETAKLLSAVGIKSAAISANTHHLKRDAVMRKLKSGKIQVVCNHTILTEGNDIPAIDLVVLNRFTESRCLWRQMTGRGLRTSAGKNLCTILDLAGNGVFHGSIYDREIFDLSGHVQATESRVLSACEFDSQEYNHNQGEELKEWKPSPKPVRIIESLQRLKLTSPLRRLQTA